MKSDHNHTQHCQATGHTGTATGAAPRTGIWLPLACAVHCLGMPLLVAAAPALTGHVQQLAWIEWGTLALALWLGYKQLWPGYQVHKNGWSLGVAVAGGATFVVGILAHDWHLDAMHTPLMVAGSLLLATGFWLNYRAQKAQVANCC